MICSHCGSEINPEGKEYCPECGYPLGSVATPLSPVRAAKAADAAKAAEEARLAAEAEAARKAAEEARLAAEAIKAEEEARLAAENAAAGVSSFDGSETIYCFINKKEVPIVQMEKLCKITAICGIALNVFFFIPVLSLITNVLGTLCGVFAHLFTVKIRKKYGKERAHLQYILSIVALICCAVFIFLDR